MWFKISDNLGCTRINLYCPFPLAYVEIDFTYILIINDKFEDMKKLIKNKYILTLLIFTVWMLFFDQNSFLSQRKITKELNQLEARKKLYSNQNEALRNQKEELLGSTDNLEKLAREKYLMKRDDEDVYLIKTDD